MSCGAVSELVSERNVVRGRNGIFLVVFQNDGSVTLVDGFESLVVVDFPGCCSLRPGTRLYSTSTSLAVFLHAVEIQVLAIRETCSTSSASETFVVGRTGTGFYRRWSIALKKKKTSDRVKAIKSSVG
jgi:hypothetical protein